jgi:hypothetical protein
MLMKNEGKTRHDLGREDFVKKVWGWAANSGGGGGGRPPSISTHPPLKMRAISCKSPTDGPPG